MNIPALTLFLSSLCTQIYGQSTWEKRNYVHEKCVQTIKSCVLTNTGLKPTEEDPFRYELPYCIAKFIKPRIHK